MTKNARALVDGEAIKQSVAPGRAQVILRAAPSGAARRMPRIPAMHPVVFARTLPVIVAEHGAALRTARPVLAGHVLVGRECFAVRGGASQNIVAVRLIAKAIYDLTLLGQIVLLIELRY